VTDIARPILFTAAALSDSRFLIDEPAAMLLSPGEDRHVLASGRLNEVLRHPVAASAHRVDVPDSILIPGLANAHTHLDLTHIGPLPFDSRAGFRSFIDAVRSRRCTEPAAIERSVRLGAALLRNSGTVAVGDIAGAVKGLPALVASDALKSAGVIGVSYIEFFAMSASGPELIRDIESLISGASMADSPLKLGLQPHAPYSVSPRSYAAAIALGSKLNLPVCTHLAETPEEVEFIARGTGPLRQLLESLGVWHPELETEFGRAESPVAHVVGRFGNPRNVVHVNHCSNDDMETLKSADSNVIYCPRSSDYFGWSHVFGPHRYQDMMKAGINIALGTDSIINLPQHDRISVLDEMRFLHARDSVSPQTLLAMATVNVARTLGIPADRFLFRTDAAPLGVLAIRIDGSSDPMGQIMRNNEQPRMLWSRW